MEHLNIRHATDLWIHELSLITTLQANSEQQVIIHGANLLV